jgi:ribosome-binding factor A
LALLVKNQIRRVPELFFYNDDSLEYIDSIELALKKTEDPIKNSSLLPKRKNI